MELFIFLACLSLLSGFIGFGVGLIYMSKRTDEEMSELLKGHRAELFNTRADAWNRGYHAGNSAWIKAEAKPVSK